MELKKELIIGIIGSVLIIFLTFFYINQYRKQKKQFKQISQNGIISQAPQTSSILLTMDEIAKHNSVSDCWIIVQNSVYDVTQYLNLHPGGANRITPFCGQDATNAYSTKGGSGSHSSQADNDLNKLKLGQLNEKVNVINTDNQIKNNIKSINSSGRKNYEDD